MAKAGIDDPATEKAVHELRQASLKEGHQQAPPDVEEGEKEGGKEGGEGGEEGALDL